MQHHGLEARRVEQTTAPLAPCWHDAFGRVLFFGRRRVILHRVRPQACVWAAGAVVQVGRDHLATI